MVINRRILGISAVAVAFAVGTAVPLWVGEQLTAASEQGAVAEGGTASDSGEGTDSAGAAPVGQAQKDWHQKDAEHKERTESFPAKTAGTGAKVLSPRVLADGTKEFRLTAKKVKWEVEPGKFVDAMAYNGVVPGPTLKVDVGDRVKVVVRNELPESTTVHFHGIPIKNDMDGVPDITQPPITPGGTFTYSLTADRPAVGWYHSHLSGTEQVSSGLFGQILMGEVALPKQVGNDVKISQEIPFVVQDSEPIGLSINGKSFPATQAIRAKRGEWVMLHYFNAGMQEHPMHLHGLTQQVVAKDGFPLDSPYKADVVKVAPGERLTVLVKADNPGDWIFHCHIFSHAEGGGGFFGMATEFHVS